MAPILPIYGPLSIPEVGPGVLLKYAHLIQNGKYLYLRDAPCISTEEERIASPAMYSENAQPSGGHLNLSNVSETLLNAFAKNTLITIPPDLLQILVTLNTCVKEARIIHDRRIKDPLIATLSLVEQQKYPAIFEDIKEVSDDKKREFYYSLKYAVRRIKVLLNWYTLPTLYIGRYHSSNSSVSTRHTILSSDRERATAEVVASWFYNHNYNPDMERWELLANNEVILTLERLGSYDDLYAYVKMWDERSDDLLIQKDSYGYRTV